MPTDLDPGLRRALDSLAAGGDAVADWQDVLRRAGAIARRWRPGAAAIAADPRRDGARRATCTPAAGATR